MTTGAIILHLMPAAEWQRLGPDAPVTNPSLTTEGFIHCTDDAQVLLRIANAFYAGDRGDFVVLHIDTSRLVSPCIWEQPAHISDSAEPFAAQFPHIYGPINRDAVVGVQSVVRDASGTFVRYGEAVPNA